MCRARARYRWPALLPAAFVVGLTSPAPAQSLSSKSTDARDEPSNATTAGSLDPAPFVRPLEDAASGVGRDAGITFDGPDASPSAEAKSPAAPDDAGPIASKRERTSPEDNPAFLNATINQIDIGDVFVILRGKDLLVKVADLEKPGLHVPEGKREKHEGDVLVSLRSLAPRSPSSSTNARLP